MLELIEKGSDKYPNDMKSWERNWDSISPIFKVSADVRKLTYTTKAVEVLNTTYKKLIRQRSIFPSYESLLKALYLSTKIATKKWVAPLRNKPKVYGEFQIMYPYRMPE